MNDTLKIAIIDSVKCFGCEAMLTDDVAVRKYRPNAGLELRYCLCLACGTLPDCHEVWRRVQERFETDMVLDCVEWWEASEP